MPEGDTVWLAARRLHDALANHVLLASDFRVPQLAAADLSGRAVLGVVSRGKHLLLRVEDGLTLHTHLRMDGSWHLYRSGERWRGGPAFHVRVVLTTAGWQAVGYRLPVVELLSTADEGRVVGHLGPDLLGPDWDAGEALRRLRTEPDREIGQALLDQRLLAWIGNLYKNELCFLSGVSPWVRVAEVDEVADVADVREVGDVAELVRMVNRAKRLLEANKGTYHQVTTGDRRRGQEHWVFERAGRPCRRCGTAILMAEQGDPPRRRLSYWCPVCQPGSAPPPVRGRDMPGARVGRTR